MLKVKIEIEVKLARQGVSSVSETGNSIGQGADYTQDEL
jgi:hypothetical protein